jgi:hypothetical protein
VVPGRKAEGKEKKTVGGSGTRRLDGPTGRAVLVITLFFCGPWPAVRSAAGGGGTGSGECDERGLHRSMVPCTHLDVANSWAWALLSRLGLQLLDLTRIELHRDTHAHGRGGGALLFLFAPQSRRRKARVLLHEISRVI